MHRILGKAEKTREDNESPLFKREALISTKDFNSQFFVKGSPLISFPSPHPMKRAVLLEQQELELLSFALGDDDHNGKDEHEIIRCLLAPNAKLDERTEDWLQDQRSLWEDVMSDTSRIVKSKEEALKKKQAELQELRDHVAFSERAFSAAKSLHKKLCKNEREDNGAKVDSN